MRYTYLLFLIFLGFCGSILGQSKKTALTIREAFLNEKSDEILLVAHRGDWRNAPENSLLSIQMAIDIGVDIVEIDVQRTKDGKLILMHDETLERTTSAKGKVSNWTLDSLNNVKLRNGLGRITHEKIPTLKEAMLLAKGKVMINLDKCYDYFPEVYEILEETETVDHVIMKGWYSFEKVQKDLGYFLDKIIYMPVISLNDSIGNLWISEFLKELNPEAIEFIFASDTSEVIDQFPEIHNLGTRVWVNSLWPSLCGEHDDDQAVTDPDKSWGWLIDHGVSIIQTDRPVMLMEYVRRFGKN